MIFGLPFVTMYNLFSYFLAWFLASNPQKATEKGFQYVILPTIAVYGLGSILVGATGVMELNYVFPFNCLSLAFSNIMLDAYTTDDSPGIVQNVLPYLIAMVVQSVIFFFVGIWLDNRRVMAYQGQDGAQHINYQPTLQSGQDVEQQKNLTHQIWN